MCGKDVDHGIAIGVREGLIVERNEILVEWNGEGK